ASAAQLTASGAARLADAHVPPPATHAGNGAEEARSLLRRLAELLPRNDLRAIACLQQLVALLGADASVPLREMSTGLDRLGFEVCRRLKGDERTAGIPVIFVTASDQTEEETRGFAAGGVDYITKPFQPPTVRARVRTHLELKDARDLLAQLAALDPLTGITN